MSGNFLDAVVHLGRDERQRTELRNLPLHVTRDRAQGDLDDLILFEILAVLLGQPFSVEHHAEGVEAALFAERNFFRLVADRECQRSRSGELLDVEELDESKINRLGRGGGLRLHSGGGRSGLTRSRGGRGILRGRRRLWGGGIRRGGEREKGYAQRKEAE